MGEGGVDPLIFGASFPPATNCGNQRWGEKKGYRPPMLAAHAAFPSVPLLSIFDNSDQRIGS
jgi:hypothetical protein